MIRGGASIVTIEVKSGRSPDARAGTEAFKAAFGATRSLLVGGDGIPFWEFLSRPATPR